MKKRIRTTLMSMLAIALLLSIVALPALATPPTDDENDICDTPSLCEPENEINYTPCYFESDNEDLAEIDLSEVYYEIIHLTMEEFCEMVIANTYGNPSFNPYNGYLIDGQFFIPPVAEQDPNGDYTVPHLCTHHAPIPNFMPFNNYRLWHIFEGFVQGEGGQQGRYRAYFRGQNNIAFCGTPEYQAMTSRFYDVAMIQTPSDNPLLAKIMYFGYGGPSGANLWGYSVTHWLVAHAYPGSSFNGSVTYAAQIAQANARPLPPCGFLMVFYGNAGEWLVSDTGSNQRRQRFVTWNYTPAGHLEIIKVSSNPTMSENNPLYSLEGAVFNVFSGNTLLGTITTNAEGRGRLDNIDSRLTGLFLVEVEPPRGFALNPTQIPFEIVSNQTTTVTVENRPQNDPPGIILRKRDADTNAPTPQGNAGLEGAEFTLRFYAGIFHTAEELSNVTPVRTWIVRTDSNGVAFLHQDYLVSGDDFYFAGNSDPTLPLGTLTIQESRPPEGYLINDELFIRHITAYGHAESVFTFSAPIVPEEVIRGGVHVEKWDIERNQAGLTQGDATLAGTVFEIINRSTNSVFVNGTLFAPGAVVHIMTTNADGVAATANNLLPFGTYEVRERTTPTGYLPTGVLSQTFDITRNEVIVRLNMENTAIKNDIIRGGVYVEKWDNEIGKNQAQGAGTLEGAIFEIVNRSADSVLVQGTLYAPGEVVYTMTPTDSTGATSTYSYLLPFGTYEVREISPPYQGYLTRGILSRTFEIREHGVIVELNTEDTAIRNDPIRGDLRGVKIAEGTAQRLANVPFRITSMTTGESHVIVTDANGEFNTHSSWNPHSQNTNRGETYRDGIWFGDIETLDDNVGALLFDRYIIEELRAPANEGFELLKFEVSIHRHMHVVDLGTLTNIRIPEPEIFTSAMDSDSRTNIAFTSESTTIIDTIYYNELVGGREYTIKGTLMVRENNEPLLIDGQPVTTERTFRALSGFGTVSTEFTFNSIGLEGKSIVVFQEVFDGDELIAEHTDIDCELQTITFLAPKISTFASGIDGEKDLEIRSDVTLIDIVFFENLIVGKQYTLRGILMDKETNEPLLIEGSPVTAERTFRPSYSSGEIDVTFTFSSVGLIGQTVVVFQELYFNDRLIAEHTDIDCEYQTVTFLVPTIGTTAHGADGNKLIPLDENAVVIDVVEFVNLVPGKTYTLVGVLMDRATGRPVLIDGEPITAYTRFVATASSGSVDVVFTFDSTTLAGKTLVVFEWLYYEGTVIAEHTDIDCEAQTVFIAEKTENQPETEPESKQPGAGAQTGQEGLPMWALYVLGGSVIIGSLLMLYNHRRFIWKKEK